MDVRALTAAAAAAPSYPLPHRQQHLHLGDASMDIDPRTQPQNGYASSDADADADYDEDDEDDNEEEDPQPPAPTAGSSSAPAQSYPASNGHPPQRINLAHADPQLYGLRRSVSNARSPHHISLSNSFAIIKQSRSRDTPSVRPPLPRHLFTVLTLLHSTAVRPQMRPTKIQTSIREQERLPQVQSTSNEKNRLVQKVTLSMIYSLSTPPLTIPLAPRTV